MAYDDPEEFTGTTQTVKADPHAGPVAPLKVSAPVVGHADKKPGSHSKVAIVGPRKAWEAAKLETQAARIELQEATTGHRAAEVAEGSAVAAWCGHPKNRPDPDQVTRDYINREGELRAANVKAGLPANHRPSNFVDVDGKIKPRINAADNSPLTRAAIARGPHAGGSKTKAGRPLRSDIPRRVV